MVNREEGRLNRLKRKHVMIERRREVKKIINPNDASCSTTAHDTSETLVQPDKQPQEDSTVSKSHSMTTNVLLLDLGFPEYKCKFCGAIFWFAERLKSSGSRSPIFSQCCRQGRIKLPRAKECPFPLKQLMDYGSSSSSKLFREGIRTYNSMFAFTSTGAKIDRDINKNPGPYIFKINGQNHHLIGSLLPQEGEKPHFAQLYIYDTENEIVNRMSTLTKTSNRSNVDEEIVSELIAMFDRINELVKVFRMARDRFTSGQTHSLSLTLCGKRIGDGSQYNAPTAAEMAGLIVGDLGKPVKHGI